MVKVVKQAICFGVAAMCVATPVSAFADSTDTYEAKGVTNYTTDAVEVEEDTEEETITVTDSKDGQVLFTIPAIDNTYHVTASKGLYIRVAPSTQSESIKAVVKNTNLDVIGLSEDEDWAVILYKDEYAFVAKDYIEEGAAPKPVAVASSVSPSNNTGYTQSAAPSTSSYSYSGSQLTAAAGVNYGPSGKETYYNLPMQGVVSIMNQYGYSSADYAVRADGVKTLGGYVMVAADLNQHPRGSLVQTSLGTGIVCDTGGFASNGSGVALDIATSW